MRIELIHPMVVHFPLALLLIGACLRGVTYFLRNSQFYPYFVISSWIILTLGVCSAWLAVIAGEMAEDIIRKNLCQPEVLNDHRQLAYTAAILFTGALLFDWIKFWRKNAISPSLNKVLSLARLILYGAAAAILISAGYFGGSLVYEQGAAVEKRCTQNP